MLTVARLDARLLVGTDDQLVRKGGRCHGCSDERGPSLQVPALATGEGFINGGRREEAAANLESACPVVAVV